MGGVICVGYFKEGTTEGQKKELSKALAHFNLPHQDIDLAVSKVKALEKDELAVLLGAERSRLAGNQHAA